ncbi:hypothetical protein DFA_09564 [Cavenderia fasciculata]|uniref:Amine oxidase domain-containing protein n=1 Tax=Cavenderia fasciculata TaxID=261658 RepID=F4Q7Z5_CACFS|nr:uncharacterized protein DFA_09564 [Cavenderia fasciculata]EGG15895.1 hypothetical protein DFA_09564 [Cavenderia fasciculata]|eukprot:XP_004352220.1 hypothetical protein DFA_09564 [Cavenderia fasciculata]
MSALPTIKQGDKFDVAVIGGGPIGLSTAYNLAKDGKKVVLLERSNFFHPSGSSGDLVRMLRSMYTEDFMADLAKETLGLWTELENDSAESLVWMGGLLNFGNPEYGAGGPEGTLNGPIENLIRLGMPYRQLDSKQIMDEFPFRNLPSTYEGLWSPDNGCINLPLLLRTLYRMCQSYGVQLVQQAPVTKMTPVGTDKVVIEVRLSGATNPVTIEAIKAAITCGAYTNHVLRPSFGFELDLDIWEMMYSYFSSNAGPQGTLFKSMWFQFEENNQDGTSNLFYGFPALPWGPANACRVALDDAKRKITDPDQATWKVEDADISLTRKFVEKHLPGLDPTPIFCGSALQTNVYDNMFVLDHIPQHPNIVVFTAGWAMKFVPLIGRILKELLVDGTTKYDISHFKITRGNNRMIKYLNPTTPTPTSSTTPLSSVTSPQTFSNAVPHPVLTQLFRAPSRTTTPGNFAPSVFSMRGYYANRCLSKAQAIKDAAHQLKASIHPAPQASPSDPLMAKQKCQKKFQDLNIGIIGAGMSGLYSGMILDELGIKYHILESNNTRIGGRIYTYKYSDKPFDYVDFGAMRYPEIPIMDRVIGQQHWSLFNKLKQKGHEIKTEPYHLSADNNIVYYNGKRIFSQDTLEKDPLFFADKNNGGLGTAVPDVFAEQPYSDWLYMVYDRFAKDLEDDFDTGFEKLMAADSHSTRSYLGNFDAPENLRVKGQATKGYPEPVISWCETMDSASGLYDQAFSESIMDYFDFSGQTWKCIDGGSVEMVKAMEKVIKGTISKGKRVTKISPTADKTQLTINVAGDPTPLTYDHVISTVPLSCLRKMNLKDLKMSHKKRVAIRTLHYDQSCKIAVRFAKRWWQDPTIMKGKHFKGGKSSTDLPLRTVVYPSYGVEDPNAPGVLIASYTWAQDAARIGALLPSNKAQLIDIVFANLAEIHDVSEQFLVDQLGGMSKDKAVQAWDWYDDGDSMGAFALYGPGQFSSLFPSLVKPEANGLFHVSGEGSSVHHGWVVGSLSSAYRAVDQILEHNGLVDKRIELREKWGTIEEADHPTGTVPKPDHAPGLRSFNISQLPDQLSMGAAGLMGHVPSKTHPFGFVPQGIRKGSAVGGFTY